MSVSRIPPQYRLGLLWSVVVALLVFVLLGWGVTRTHPVRPDGWLFVAWVLAVPLVALAMRRVCT